MDYYPSLAEIMAADVSILLNRNVSSKSIEDKLHNLDSENEVLVTAIQSGDYYNAVGHTDAVYRMFLHFKDHPDAMPRYSQIVVDEFQDFSLLEVQLIKLLSEVSPTLIVGDDDQALYGFKHASPKYLRDFANSGEYERFDLPYCSRCTDVLVRAVNRVIDVARTCRLLEGRLPKPFICYMPSKRPDSERYPKIVHALCTVQTKKAPYMARYIEEQIREIPDEDVEQSDRGNYPTVLVTGPVQFATSVYDYLSAQFKSVEYKRSEPPKLSLLDGYRRLLSNPSSRLGWRIVSHLNHPDSLTETVRAAVLGGQDLGTLLPSPYRVGHLELVDCLRRIMDHEPIGAEEVLRVESALEMQLSELERRLRVDAGEAEEQPPDGTTNEAIGEREPRIVVTSPVGAKGLQACHVFVVGVNEGHFPRFNERPTDSEVCQLIVALTRATKCCNFVSCGRFGGSRVKESIFVRCLDEYIQRVDINAAYFTGTCAAAM